MAAPKLTSAQRLKLLAWIAADYSNQVIFRRAAAADFPALEESTLSYYRRKHRAGIEELRQQRCAQALAAGLALKAERIARLCEHADELELLKWQMNDKGRLVNEKAWRETLRDIAEEMGERRPAEKVQAEEIVKVYVGIDLDKV
jgi:hypothetical protein